MGDEELGDALVQPAFFAGAFFAGAAFFAGTAFLAGAAFLAGDFFAGAFLAVAMVVSFPIENAERLPEIADFSGKCPTAQRRALHEPCRHRL